MCSSLENKHGKEYGILVLREGELWLMTSNRQPCVIFAGEAWRILVQYSINKRAHGF